ncbi:MAG: DegV family protein [Clostridia bacterium]|nr:DegV family protein [Clostridia bacterium]
MKTIITSDSSCDLSKEQVKEYNIYEVPISVILGENEFKDGVDIFPEDIFDYVKQNKKLPKTAAISSYEYSEFFKSVFEKEGDVNIVHIGLGSKISSSFNNALEAAKEFDGKVIVVDGNNLSSGTGLLVLYAAKLAKDGLEASEIAQKVEERVAFVQAGFIIQEVSYLYKGGRCSAMALIGANLLRIKPRIQVIDGAMKNVGKPRGKMLPVLKQYVDDVLKEYNNPDKAICFVTHSSIEPEIADEIVEYVKSKNIFDEVVQTVASSTITSHCGKGTLGILYINDGGKA